ncbi:Uma2 family endonuclease [Aerosakkonema funiforme]|uniref:Uma2 family endonuclease n=1 Tax=Aerosakkonema funiforme TaxID=1246630 RepID=UPI0035BB43ED
MGDGDCVEGTPELIAEVAATSAFFDLSDKLRVYGHKGVQEHLIWRIYDKQLN